MKGSYSIQLKSSALEDNKIQYNIHLLGLDRTQAQHMSHVQSNSDSS